MVGRVIKHNLFHCRGKYQGFSIFFYLFIYLNTSFRGWLNLKCSLIQDTVCRVWWRGWDPCSQRYDDGRGRDSNKEMLISFTRCEVKRETGREGRGRFIYLGNSGNVPRKSWTLKHTWDLSRPRWGRGITNQNNTSIKNRATRAKKQESKGHIEWTAY